MIAPAFGIAEDPATGSASGPRMPRGGPRDPNKRFSDPLHIFARYARAQARGEPVGGERVRFALGILEFESGSGRRLPAERSGAR